MTRPLYIIGMHGLGDALHQRAIIAEHIKTRDVWLETPWPSVYHDMVGPRLHLVNKGSKLRTQAKNTVREAALFSAEPAPSNCEVRRIGYTPANVRAARSVLGAMAHEAGVPVGDFRMGVPYEWYAPTPGVPWDAFDGRPLIIYRPLMDRSEWGGCGARNPEVMVYAETLQHARDQLGAFVISLADLEPGCEWLVGQQPEVDLQLHDGSLDFRALASLWFMADLVISSPGFAIPLAQAVGTPSVVVFGGYEGNYSFDAGARYTPTLAIGQGCDCFSHKHTCFKGVNMENALGDLSRFIDQIDH